jgi:hypothetical protein
MAEVRLTLEEYEALRRMISSERESEGATLAARDTPKPRKRKKNKRLSKALEMANEKLRTKNGKLRKGKSQSDVMTMAHRLMKQNKV